ncbi:isochorismatase family protein [Cordyceps militaris CM01]|uniref:Isochorismatase family protein n=1 Tax=Cordyceps militaris (strain CM01) TaxID=983644 RepID=G3J2V4_CORMM|nr:isochorismatase family protein [Cordyceps militaris CM01]EGX97233.1 isochorismatase family protein [Cordyceps militaris CM01]
MTVVSLAASPAPAVRSSSSVVVGSPSNFWLFSHRHGFDMTHPPTPDAPPVYPRLTLTTSNSPVTIAPAKTALVIIDMQNFFLSAAMGRKRGEGHEAETVLLEQGIPAAREAGIQVVWLTWGISEEGIKTLPPTVWRIFGWEIADDDQGFEVPAGADDAQGDEASGPIMRVPERKSHGGIGSELGSVTLADGSVVDAGKMLLRDQWNTRLHGPLEEAFEAGQRAAVPDVRFHKERLSGLWGDAHSNHLETFLRKRGLQTLLFAGVNTDQCVLATVQDASSKGFDTVLLRDGCGTTSPEYARQMVDFNCQKSWGFISSCEALARGVKGMVKDKPMDGGGS